MPEEWMIKAAERIFSHAIDWEEGRKNWRDEDVANIIMHEMAEGARDAMRNGQRAACPAPAGIVEETR